jgi:hypothetical protein
LSGRWTFAFGLIAMVALGCSPKLKSGRCDHDGGDCGEGMYCDVGAQTCRAIDGGIDANGGASGHGGAGGAAGAKGTGGTPFTCPNATCKGATPICDVDAGACRGCNQVGNTAACSGLDAGTNACVTAAADAGAKLGMCVACVSKNDCKSAAAAACNTATNTCVECVDKSTCGGSKAACNTATNACVECVDKNTCGLTKPACNTTTFSCVACVDNTTCTGTKPICELTGTSAAPIDTCRACASDAECTIGPGICLADGHCASDGETIYVQSSSTCSDMPDGGVGGGTKAHPYCTLGPVAAAVGPTRDLVIVIGTVSTSPIATWTYANQATSGLTIIGQQSATIASSTAPGFSMTSGSVLIKNVLFNSSTSVGISATGGTLNLDSVTVDSCKGGILLNGASFDIENTTVSNNRSTQTGSTMWGGILYGMVASGPTKLNLVSITGNKAEGLSCAGAITGTGVFAANNTGGDVQDYCGITVCSQMGPACGAQ